MGADIGAVIIISYEAFGNILPACLPAPQRIQQIRQAVVVNLLHQRQ